MYCLWCCHARLTVLGPPRACGSVLRFCLYLLFGRSRFGNIINRQNLLKKKKKNSGSPERPPICLCVCLCLGPCGCCGVLCLVLCKVLCGALLGVVQVFKKVFCGVLLAFAKKKSLLFLCPLSLFALSRALCARKALSSPERFARGRRSVRGWRGKEVGCVVKMITVKKKGR